jgi:3-ketosteroid 9alpha-monooxygenase subunit A
MFCHGWYQLAFERELDKDVNAADIGSTRLLVVRQNGVLRTFNADCPHRGTNLALGGKLDGRVIVCPFHAYRIGLGITSRHGFQVQQYPTLTIGGLVFVRLSEGYDNGFSQFIESLTADHTFVPGFALPIKAAAELVIENGFDNRHFPAVHQISNYPKFNVRPGDSGELLVESIFEVPMPGRVGTTPQTMMVPYLAHTFSPGLIVVELNGNPPYKVLTGSLPLPDGTCVARLSLLLPKATHGDSPSPQFCDYLLKHTKGAMQDDQVMWENMRPGFPARYTAQDEAVLEFHKYCQQFRREYQA